MSIVSYDDFYAFCDHKQGSPRLFRVGGTVVFSTGGWTALLTEREGPNGINQLMLHLDLVVSPPGSEVSFPQQITPFELTEFTIESPSLEYPEAQFHLSGGPDGDVAPPAVDVVHTE